MLKIRHWKSDLPFIYPFTISKGTKTHQPSLIVEITWPNGMKGYGEAPAIAYYDVTVEAMQEVLESKRKVVESFAFMDPKRFWHFLHHLFPKDPFLVCALDMAGWDLWGKIKRKPLHEVWGLDMQKSPETDYTIGIDPIEIMLKKIAENPAPIYKIKVGGEDDLNKLKEIRKHTDANLRVDANAGWTFEQALEIIPVLETLGVELIEQPLHKDDYEGSAKLRGISSIPIIADESCVGIADVVKCKDVFDGINIKLTKCSGITLAMDMIKIARSHHMKIMLGCMNESSVGTAAMVHLSPLVDYLDADGPLLLAEDIATGLTYTQHRISPSTKFGLGVDIL